jgi:two-component system chemotaxis response regulator CheY
MGKTILVVDDSATVRQQLRLVLGPAGYDVVEATDGQDGLQQIRGNRPPDLVICDINMPRMNGIEMLQAVAPDNTGIPIVMLTTEGRPELVKAAKAAGAKGWIIKPFKADLLVRAVQSLVG